MLCLASPRNDIDSRNNGSHDDFFAQRSGNQHCTARYSPMGEVVKGSCGVSERIWNRVHVHFSLLGKCDDFKLIDAGAAIGTLEPNSPGQGWAVGTRRVHKRASTQPDELDCAIRSNNSPRQIDGVLRSHVVQYDIDAVASCFVEDA